MTRSTIATVLAVALSAAASAQIAPPKPAAELVFEQKMSWILRFEDQRILRDPAPPPAPPPPPAAPTRTKKKGARAVVPPPPPPPPDLLRLLTDGEARIRRRAALAVGRAGLAEGVGPLVALMSDADPEVRQMAAFALGLIGDARARDPLIAALADPTPLMRGSAAEALGLIGDVSAAQPIAEMATAIIASGALAQLPPDAVDASRDTAPAAFRLAIYALVRLKAYDALASAVLDAAGQPRVRWWPVAFALQRLEDRRALPALLTLLNEPHPYTKAFAAKGLGAMSDLSAVSALVPLVSGGDATVAVEAVRSLGRLRTEAGVPALVKVIQTPNADPHLRLEAVGALGQVGRPGEADLLIDLLGDRNPSLRAAALRALARIDPEGFITILSGLDQDAHWSVRAALAAVLATLSPETGLPRLRAMLNDTDPRVVPAVLAGFAKLHPPDAAAVLVDALRATDAVVRAAAANALAELKAPIPAATFADAYRRGDGDQTYLARAAALSALVACSPADASPILSRALGDKEWPVRIRAAALLKQLDPSSDPSVQMRPAPTLHPARYEIPRITNPPVSTHAFVETTRGTIQLEMAVLDAPLTVESFVTLARAHFFDGVAVHRVVPGFVVQAGDPRGDGEGGPGFTIRDEINQRPYLRGTVGMALDWADTGGSQFFIAHAPQPHLDAKYTVFGRVIAGMDVVDRIEQWDVIERVRVWDGTAAEN